MLSRLGGVGIRFGCYAWPALSTGFSFKEITTYSFGITPRYIGLFALKGFVDSTATVSVKVRYFRLEGQNYRLA